MIYLPKGGMLTPDIWLRSGNNENAYKSNYLTSSGYRNNTYSARRFAVRPALHSAVYERKNTDSRFRRVH